MTKRVRLSDKQTRKKLPPGPGRPKGSPNKTTRVLKEAMLLAAERAGSDGKGKDGLVGYLTRLAIRHPTTFGPMLARTMTLQVKLDLERNTQALLDALEGEHHATQASTHESERNLIDKNKSSASGALRSNTLGATRRSSASSSAHWLKACSAIGPRWTGMPCLISSTRCLIHRIPRSSRTKPSRSSSSGARCSARMSLKRSRRTSSSTETQMAGANARSSSVSAGGSASASAARAIEPRPPRHSPK